MLSNAVALPTEPGAEAVEERLAFFVRFPPSFLGTTILIYPNMDHPGWELPVSSPRASIELSYGRTNPRPLPPDECLNLRYGHARLDSAEDGRGIVHIYEPGGHAKR